MWKPIGVISTACLVIISILALAFAAWCYDKNSFQDVYSKYSSYRPYIDALRAVIAIDLLMFITSFVGIFFLVKPSAGASKCYVVFIILIIIMKIVAGAIWYSGVNDAGKQLNNAYQTYWDYLSSARIDKPDSLVSWHTQRGAEIASIILFIVLGGLSGISVLKVYSEERENN